MSLTASYPARKLVEITPSDDTDLKVLGVRGLWVGTTGDLSLKGVADTDAVTVANVPAGTLIPVAVSRVMAATTASDIVGFI